MTSKSYDVVLVPETRIAEQAIQLSTKLAECDSYFTLDGKTYFPHLSLYMLQLNEAGLSKALDFLKDVASKTKAVKATAHDYHYENDYLDVEYPRTEDFSELQKIILEGLNPIRDGLREREKVRLQTATGAERENILSYGYRSIGEQFYPHLTFTHFKSNQEAVLTTLPSKETFIGIFPTLGLYEMGDHGTCVREVMTWPLLVQ